MIGRGLLGRWGPNHAADPLVTRYMHIIYLLILQEKGLIGVGGGGGGGGRGHHPGMV